MIYACRNALRGLAFLPKQSHQSSAISEAVSILKSPTQYPLQELTAAYENLGETLAGSATATEYDVYSAVDCALLAILAYETASLDQTQEFAYNGSVAYLMAAKRNYGKEGVDGAVDNAIRDLVKLELEHCDPLYSADQILTARLWESWQPTGSETAASHPPEHARI